MNVDAVSLFGAAEIKQRRGSLTVVALITALVVAVILATTAGARRTSSTLDRYLAATDSTDVMMGTVWPTLSSDGERISQVLDEVRSSPGVEAARVDAFVPLEAGTENDFGALVPYAARDASDRALLQVGRYPADDAPDEVALNESAARELGLGVGDELIVDAMDRPAAVSAMEGGENFAMDDVTLELQVVGVVRSVDDLSPTGAGFPVAFASPAFRAGYSDVAILGSLFRLDVDESAFDLLATRAILERAVPSRAETWADWRRTEFASIGTAFDSIAIGLTIFAAIGLVVGILVLAQVMARQTQLGRDDRDAGRTLGMTRSELTLGCAGPLALAMTPGVAVGSLLAYAASGLFPYSVARRAEVGGLLRFDPLVHIGLAVLVSLLLFVVAGVMSYRSTSPITPSSDHGGSRFARLCSRLAPPLADGCSAVVGARARRSSIRPWTAICGAAIGVAGITAIGVFESSRTAATDDPPRFGATWDINPDPMFAEAGPDAAILALAEDPRTDGVGGVFCGMPTMTGQPTQLCTYEIMAGTIEPSLSAGRTPTSPDEIALGKETAARFGVEIGDRIELADSNGEPIALTVVGTAVNPGVADSPRPGSGAIMTTEGLEHVLGSIWEQPTQTLIISVTDGLDPVATAEALALDHPIGVSAVSFAQPPEDLAQLGRMRPSLVALACFLGGLGVVGLLHYLVLSGRRRRREVAVLRALGFVRRQVVASTATQAMTVAAIGVVIGLPLGVIVGRWTWLAAVDDLGMIDTPTIPTVMLISVVVVALVGAALVAAAPGWRAVQLRPASGLREE